MHPERGREIYAPLLLVVQVSWQAEREKTADDDAAILFSDGRTKSTLDDAHLNVLKQREKKNIFSFDNHRVLKEEEEEKKNGLKGQWQRRGSVEELPP